MEGIQEEAEFDFGDPALLNPTVETSDAIGDVILGSPASSAEATSPFTVDDEVSFLLPGTTMPSQPAKFVAPIVQLLKPVGANSAKQLTVAPGSFGFSCDRRH